MNLKNIESLRKAILKEEYGAEIQDSYITGASYIYQTTQFPNTSIKYKNYYVLYRINSYFGACSYEKEQLDLDLANENSGKFVKDVIKIDNLPIRIATMDAFLGSKFLHKENCNEKITIPSGTPLEKANARDELIARLANVEEGEKVALIGVVDPLVKSIKKNGAICLPCDFNLDKTSYGDIVESDMEVVLKDADKIICTAMTLSNNTFDRILEVARERGLPLTVYAQTGSAVVAQFIGKGVTSLLAEPFPFTQFSSGATEVFLYY